jgi:hypothetical protein
MAKHNKKNDKKPEDLVIVEGSVIHKKSEPKTPKEATILPNNSDEKGETKFVSLPKRKMISKIQHGNILVREFSNIDCDGATIIEGIPK